MWGGAACVPNACGLLCEYTDTLEMLAALKQLIEELHLAPCGGEGEHMAAQCAHLHCEQLGWSTMLS